MKRAFVVFMLMGLLAWTSCTTKQNAGNVDRSGLVLEKIFELYKSGHPGLFNETFPYKEANRVTYLAGEDTLSGQRVAYLWPTSGVFSGVNALLEVTGDKKYAKILEEKILPGLENYYDAGRLPACYQSYITQAGLSDRFYDDNVWLAIDFLEACNLTQKKEYLDKSLELWQFIVSGWDEEVGGIYWCEQKKESRNTCSNAPGSVLALKLYESTDSAYFLDWGTRLYQWTKEYLQDSTDYLYFDNVKMDGRVDKAKYTYNSGQMLQAAALLYKITGDEIYLTDAKKIAKSAITHFTETFETPQGKTIRLFKNTGNWFNVILFRGYAELYSIDKNPEYIGIFRDNLEHLWMNGRDDHGLFSKDWTGTKNDEYKWLLDQAAMVEFYAALAAIQ